MNGLLNALTEDCYDEARQEAKQVDQQLATLRSSGKTDELTELFRSKPLLGVPVSIKHCFSVKGKKWTGALFALRDQKAFRDTNEVHRIRQAGAIVVCVTNMAEMTMSFESHNPVFGLTRNPYNLARIPGGSSGGEGALLGSGASVIGFGKARELEFLHTQMMY